MRWILFNILFATSCVYAATKGGPSERIVVLVFLIGRALSVLVRIPGVERYHQFQTGIFAVDLSMFFAMIILSIYTKRWWPLWMTALQGAAVVSHVMRFSPMVNGFAYYTGTAMWVYPMMILLIIGTWRRKYV